MAECPLLAAHIRGVVLNCMGEIVCHRPVDIAALFANLVQDVDAGMGSC